MTEWTVERAYSEYVAPEQTNLARGTQNDSRRYVRQWDRFTREELGIPQFDICDATSKTVAEFRDWCVNSLKLGPGQANKSFKHVLRCIRRAAEEESLTIRPLRVKALKTRPAPKFYIENSQVNALWRAAKDTVFPDCGIPPKVYWRALIEFLRTYGMRVQDLVAYESGKDPLNWSGISLSEASPSPEGRCKSPFGWLTFQASKTKRDYCLPMSRYMRGAVERLARYGTDGTLFPCPLGSGLNAEWKRLQALAGVSKPNGELYQLEDFRKTCATFLFEYQSELSYLVCGWTTAASKIAHDHYIAAERMLVKYLPDAPVPKCFRKWAV